MHIPQHTLVFLSLWKGLETHHHPKEYPIALNLTDRIHAAAMGTLYDFVMIPYELSQALVKAPLALVRPILIYALNKDKDYLNDFSFQILVFHTCRVIGFLCAFICNPFISLYRPDYALKLHEKYGLIKFSQDAVESIDEVKTVEDTEAQIQYQFLLEKNQLYVDQAYEIANNILQKSHNLIEFEVYLEELEEIKKAFESDPENEFLDKNTFTKFLKSYDEAIEISKKQELAFNKELKISLTIAYEQGLTQFDPSFLLQDIEVKSKFFEVYKLKNEKKINLNLQKNSEHLLARKLAKAHLAIAAGVNPISTKEGVHGAVFVRSVTDKILGVYKIPDHMIKQEDSWTNYFWSFTKNLREFFGNGQHLLLNEGGYAEICGEKAAYIIAQKLNNPYLTLAPTEITQLKDCAGAFLVFCKNAKLASDFERMLKTRDQFTHDELNRLQSFVIFDYLIGNLDRHLKNWMIKFRKDSAIKKIIPIDNANILPKEEPSLINVDGKKSRFVWKKLKFSKLGFTDEMINWIDSLDENFVENIVDEINQHSQIALLYPLDKFISENSKKLMEARFKNLKKIGRGGILTPFQLAARN